MTIGVSHRALALAVLEAATPDGKTAAAANACEVATFGEVRIDRTERFAPPIRPGRPQRPELVAPKDTPRRRLSSPEGRAILIHAVAHIELNAIDLAFDMSARFSGEIEDLGLDAAAFVADWFEVGADEARHFRLLADRLAELGHEYGDWPAHDGLWRAAESTSDDVAARLAIAPLVLEARGLDVTPGMISKLRDAGDELSAVALSTIYAEEVDHVRKGVNWFRRVCEARRVEPESAFKRYVSERFNGPLKPPFNATARERAGMPPSYYANADVAV
ncbi:MAG: DUF455 family protein [Alphaproteobacteria bacterium]|nr:DUF455 family protein [Alphaproteobacteria bacterium]